MMSLSSFIKSKLGAFLIILPYIKPASEITGAFNSFFNLWKVISAGFIFCCCCKRKEKKNNLPIFYLILIQAIYFISTIINQADIKSAVVQLMSNVSLVVYLVWLYNENEYLAVRNFTYPTIFMAVLTSLSMFIYYPNGMYQIVGDTYTEKSNYLWGFDNTSGLLFISSMFFLVIYAMYVNKKRTYKITLFALAIFCAAFLYVGAKTTYVMMIFIIVIYIGVIYGKKQFKWLNSKVIILCIIAMFLLLIKLNSGFEHIWNYLKQVGKYYSIKARLIFFDTEFYYIAKSPLWGCGIEDKLFSSEKLLIDHPHNYFMDLLYHGGLLAVSSMGMFFFKLTRNKKNKDRISVMANCFLAAILITVMMDFYNEMYLFYPQMALTFLLLRNRKYLLSKCEINS